MGILKNMIKSYVRSTIKAEVKSANRWFVASEFCRTVAEQKVMSVSMFAHVLLGDEPDTETVEIFGEAAEILSDAAAKRCEIFHDHDGKLRAQILPRIEQILAPAIKALWEGDVVEFIKRGGQGYGEAVEVGIEIGLKTVAEEQGAQGAQVVDLQDAVVRLRQKLEASGFTVHTSDDVGTNHKRD